MHDDDGSFVLRFNNPLLLTLPDVSPRLFGSLTFNFFCVLDKNALMHDTLAERPIVSFVIQCPLWQLAAAGLGNGVHDTSRSSQHLSKVISSTSPSYLFSYP